MNKESKFSKEEKDIIAAYEKGELVSTKPSKYQLSQFQETAKKGLQKDKRINIRIPSQVLEGIQNLAVEEGMPYQTLIASILHKYSSGRLIDSKQLPKKTRRN